MRSVTKMTAGVGWSVDCLYRQVTCRPLPTNDMAVATALLNRNIIELVLDRQANGMGEA